MKIKSALVFDNLNIAVFDEKGEQIPEMQKSIQTHLVNLALELGHDPDGMVIETPRSKWRVSQNEAGWYRDPL